MMLVSGAKTEFDGRTKALIHIFSEIADLSVLSPSKDESGISDPENGYYRFLKGVLAAAKKEAVPDVLILDNRKATIPGLILRRRFRPKCTVYDARELYFMRESDSLSGKIGCFFEKRMIERADIVICAGRERKEIMEKEYRLKSDIMVFENFRSLKYSSEDAGRLSESKYRDMFGGDEFRIVSSAGCELDRGTMELVAAMEKLTFRAELLLVGCRQDDEQKKVEEYIAGHGIKNVTLLPRVNQDELKYIISNCHVGISVYHKRNLNNLYCSSGKVYEYVYEGIPVAASDNPPLKHLIDRYRIGACDQDIAEAIEKVKARYGEYKDNVAKFVKSEVVERGQAEFRKKIKEKIGEFI